MDEKIDVVRCRHFCRLPEFTEDLERDLDMVLFERLGQRGLE
jgi:hypothetical protein